MPRRNHPSIPLPQSSYSEVSFNNIRISHHPPESPTVTPVVVLKLHRPAANNAWTEDMGQEMVRAFEMFDTDDRIKVIVVTGGEEGSKGGRFFCVGADLNVGFERIRDEEEPKSDYRDGYAFRKDCIGTDGL
jgi:enoyl-CoA hydratase/carnithine racemase